MYLKKNVFIRLVKQLIDLVFLRTSQTSTEREKKKLMPDKHEHVPCLPRC